MGDRLRSLRRQKGFSLLAVEAQSEREFKASVLGAYERGERIISVLRLQRLAEIYGVTVDKLLPRLAPPGSPDDSPPTADLDADSTCRPVRIDLNRLGDVRAPESEVIRRYVGMIQLQRNEYQDGVVAIREDDLKALGRVFERDGEAMQERLVELGLHY